MAIWQQLQEMILALETKRAAQSMAQYSEPQPRQSAMEAKSHRKVKLKTMAENLMSHFTALEDDWQASWPSRKESDASTTTPQHQSEDEECGLQMLEVERSASGLQGQQDEGEGMVSDDQFGREEYETPPPPVPHELAKALNTLTTVPAWPWPGSRQSRCPLGQIYFAINLLERSTERSSFKLA